MEYDKKIILQTACATFSEAGYEKTSVANISRRAGFAQGLVLYHFANKEILYFEALKFVMSGLRDQLYRDLADLSDIYTSTAEFVHTYMDYTSDASIGYAMVYRESPFAILGNLEHMSALRTLSSDIVQILARKLTTSTDSETAQRLAAYVVTSLNGVQRERYYPVCRETLDIEELATFFASAVQSLTMEIPEERVCPAPSLQSRNGAWHEHACRPVGRQGKFVQEARSLVCPRVQISCGCQSGSICACVTANDSI